jgi:hypothetical protein
VIHCREKITQLQEYGYRKNAHDFDTNTLKTSY